MLSNIYTPELSYKIVNYLPYKFYIYLLLTSKEINTIYNNKSYLNLYFTPLNRNELTDAIELWSKSKSNCIKK